MMDGNKENIGRNWGIGRIENILLIEDNIADAKLIELLLKDADLGKINIVHKMTFSESYTELKQNNNYDVILLDLTLPDSYGIKTLQKLTQTFYRQNFIVLTGREDKVLGLEAVRSGAQDFLLKGDFDSKFLAKTLRYSVERNIMRNRLEETQRIAKIGNWEYFPDEERFYISNEIYRILGIDPAVKSFTFDDLNDKACPLHFLKRLSSETLKKKQLQKDIKFVSENGEDVYAYVQCFSYEVTAASCAVHGVLQDITERKIFEQELLKSKKRYEDVFSRSKDPIFISTLEGRLIDFNQASCELFGHSKSELENIIDIHNFFYPVEKKNEFLLKLKAQKSVKDFPIQIATKREEVRYCQISANILATRDFIGYNCIIRDITEQKQIEKLRKARKMASQSTKMKEQFIAGISHEMRTPMNAILGMSNLLSQMKLGAEETELVESIKTSSGVLLGIVNDILEISAIQNGKINFHNETFDLHDLLNGLVNVMQFKALEKDLFLEIQIAQDIPRYLIGDKLRLNQILFNLVGNAIKFTDRGFVKIVIEKLFDIADNVQLKFTIEDTGIGIPRDKLDSIFESFTRVKQKNRIFEGTGLGLSIVKNLVELQGGKINVKSELGKGSSFYFDLIFEVSEAKFLKKDKDEISLEEIFDDEAFDLLLAEDNKINQLVAIKTLKRKWKNINITVVEDGQKAIDILKKRNFDIILMDVQMPVKDGYEATSFIKNKLSAQKAKIPILAMTAHAHVFKDQKYKECGMDDYILKPFKPEEFYSKINKYLFQKLKN